MEKYQLSAHMSSAGNLSQKLIWLCTVMTVTFCLPSLLLLLLVKETIG